MTEPIPLAVDAERLVKSFGNVRAVDGVSLQVSPGEVYGILGPNGAGKTTFLRMLFGLIRPDAGTLRVHGREWATEGTGVLDGVAGFIEAPRFYPYLTGRQNLESMARLDGNTRPGLIDEVLSTVDLLDRADRKVGGWSYGMRQRLGVAASLLREPKLLVLDEPANGLDPAGIRDMRALVKDLASSGLTVLLSSHNMEEVEEICDNVTIMKCGTVAFHGSIADLRAMAPDPGHVLDTTSNLQALSVAAGRPGLVVDLDESGQLHVVGAEEPVAAYVGALVQAGIGLRQLTPTQTPLESLFFLLTDSGLPENEGAAA
ncbi:ABC transporter ATP-binding protein [Nocardioides sp. Kera G14]|uniref:ABC transporter ATP-binding protein n=1 Tax=Nocardioides sp. Kera G14 TaxID=2884264 RepID=UPI001D100845|nr:ABC transporter ATP-binding protein [Nocardioides sp. Kera G14]UDY23313.1 ABC transporter ATP-binding protein [Nocardioides sp. Kera G14]